MMESNGKRGIATAATATRNVDKTDTTDKLKRGWNWEYVFSEKVMPDGRRMTLVVEYMLHHRASETDVIISGYPGAHAYEDAAVEAIGDAFRDFVWAAREEGVAWQEVRHRHYLTGWLIDAPIDSEIVKALAAALAAINRVTVEMKLAAV